MTELLLINNRVSSVAKLLSDNSSRSLHKTTLAVLSFGQRVRPDYQTDMFRLYYLADSFFIRSILKYSRFAGWELLVS